MKTLKMLGQWTLIIAGVLALVGGVEDQNTIEFLIGVLGLPLSLDLRYGRKP